MNTQYICFLPLSGYSPWNRWRQLVIQKQDALKVELESSRQNEHRLTAQLARAEDLIEDLRTEVKKLKDTGSLDY